jgi:hypothetical protein
MVILVPTHSPNLKKKDDTNQISIDSSAVIAWDRQPNPIADETPLQINSNGP